jgi:glutamyl-tRNA reductase
VPRVDAPDRVLLVTPGKIDEEHAKAGWSETGESELDRLFRRLPQLGETERSEIRQAFERYAAKLLHPPLVSLRTESRSGSPHGLLEALKRLFDLRD